MKFFFPDSQDLVDPSFDFETEKRSPTRIRQRDDHYAHEVFAKPPYDGMLISKAIVDGTGNGGGRYTLGQRHRFYRSGVREFLRLGDRPLETMGDCGAFAYVNEPEPPVTVDDVIGFYDGCGFDYGLSVDHMILHFDPTLDKKGAKKREVPEDWQRRQEITLDLARQFFRTHKQGKHRFVPVGVAQGWSPKSYAFAVTQLQKIGFTLIALGGMVPLKNNEVFMCLDAIATVKRARTRLHLLGLSRCDHVAHFEQYGVASFDSTSPLRQAFKEDRDNYYTARRTYTAIRVPQVEGNASLRNLIVAGQVKQQEALRLERECMEALHKFDRRRVKRESVVTLLNEYQAVWRGTGDYTERYREILTDKPWRDCRCDICRKLGIHVVVFRGAERNRRRGFHNLFVTFNRLCRKRGTQKSNGRGRGQ
jgi:hypothetical protein